MVFTDIKRLFVIEIMQPADVLVNTFSVSVSLPFFMFPCSKGQSVRAYLDTIWMTLDCNIGICDSKKLRADNIDS